MPKEQKEEKEEKKDTPKSPEYHFSAKHKERRNSFIVQGGKSFETSIDSKTLNFPGQVSTRFFSEAIDKIPSFIVKAPAGYYSVIDCNIEFNAWQLIYPHLPVKIVSHGTEQRLVLPYLGRNLDELEINSMSMLREIQLGIIKSLKNIHEKGFAYDGLLPGDILVNEKNEVHIVNLHRVHIKKDSALEQNEAFSKEGAATRWGTLHTTIVTSEWFNFGIASDLSYLAWNLKCLNERFKEQPDYEPLPPVVEKVETFVSEVIINTNQDWTNSFNDIFNELIAEFTVAVTSSKSKKETAVAKDQLSESTSSLMTEVALTPGAPKLGISATTFKKKPEASEGEKSGCLPRWLCPRFC